MKLRYKSYIVENEFLILNKDFQKAFNHLERQRHDIFSVLAGIDPAFLHKAPRPGKWSIIQIVAHVMTAEELSIRYMEKKVQGIDSVRNSGPMENIKLAVLNMMQRAPFKYSAPQIVVANTPSEENLSGLQARWDDNRRKLRQILETIPEEKSRRLIYKHVIVGRLNALQALYFFREHFNHHRPQVDRILKTYQTTVASS